MPLNPKCKHDGKFYCDFLPSLGTYQFICEHGCGYYMPYNPTLFPEGVYFPEDLNRLKEFKVLPLLRSNGVGK